MGAGIGRWLIDLGRFIWFWVTFWLMTSALFIKLMYFGWKLRSQKSELEMKTHELACDWGRWVFRLNFGWSYEISGAENLPQVGDGTVIIANHCSAMDICALMTTGVQFRWLSKSAVFKMPLMGTAMRWAGYVPIVRGNAKSHKAALEKSADWIRRGVSMLYFPEGTRSPSGVMKEFKTGAFRLAEAEQVAVVPIAIVGTNKLMMKGSIIPAPAHVEVHVLPRMQRREEESLQDFMNRARQAIQMRLDSSAHQR